MNVDVKKTIKQNDIWMVSLGHECSKGHEQRGTRPVFVISTTEYNTKSKTPIGFFMSTSQKKSINKFNVEIDMQGVQEFINISQIRTLADDRFFKKIGSGTNEDRNKIMQLFTEQILEGRND